MQKSVQPCSLVCISISAIICRNLAGARANSYVERCKTHLQPHTNTDTNTNIAQASAVTGRMDGICIYWNVCMYVQIYDGSCISLYVMHECAIICMRTSILMTPLWHAASKCHMPFNLSKANGQPQLSKSLQLLDDLLSI